MKDVEPLFSPTRFLPFRINHLDSTTMLHLQRTAMMAARRTGLGLTAARITPARFYATQPPARPVRPVRAKPATVPNPKASEDQAKDEKKRTSMRRINILILLGTLAAATTLFRKATGTERRK